MPITWPGSTWQRVCSVCFSGDEAAMLAHARKYLQHDPSAVPPELHLGKEFRDIVGARNRRQWWTTAVQTLLSRAKPGPVCSLLDDYGVYFYNTEGTRLGTLSWTALPLYKGMRITIHGHDRQYTVVRWEFHHGHPDEEAGLRVVLQDQGNTQLYPARPPSTQELAG